MISVKNLCKNYNKVVANNNISFDILDSEFVVILGPSGAGKSTLLNILGGLETASSGEILVNGKDITKYSRKELTEYRRNELGFVFQFYNLIPNLTALENVKIAAELNEESLEAEEALRLVGLQDRVNNFPHELSGGEQQRVSIARAIVKKPKILFCDEPTGALDYTTGKQVLKILTNISNRTTTSVVLITHNKEIAKIADKIIEISDAKVKNYMLIKKN